jgi:hypothetical protein
MKPKQKTNSKKKPKEQEVFRHVLCNIEIMKDLYEELKDINDSLIDDLCYATEKIEKLENDFIKGLFLGALVVISIWLVSLS